MFFVIENSGFVGIGNFLMSLVFNRKKCLKYVFLENYNS